MFNCCQDCERLQANPIGTAPERPNFQQPTKYDHYDNFQKFKKLEEDELELKKGKEELLKLNSNFTDFQLHRVFKDKELEQLSTQDLATFCHKLHVGCDTHKRSESGKKYESFKNDLEDSRNEGESLKKSKSLLALTHNPIQCPISACSRTIGMTFVLSHYLRDHNEDFGVPCEEIYTGKRSMLKFDPSALNFGENGCLGILAYGGDVNERFSSPSERGLCIRNAFLPQPYEHLATHLPILIMACRTSWSMLLGNEEKEANLHNPNSVNQELLVLWLASPQTVKPVHCTVTVYDKLMTSSRSSIMQIRSLNDNQRPHDFMPREINFMRLSHAEINILSQQRTEDIHMEIMIKEY